MFSFTSIVGNKVIHWRVACFESVRCRLNFVCHLRFWGEGSRVVQYVVSEPRLITVFNKSGDSREPSFPHLVEEMQVEDQ